MMLRAWKDLPGDMQTPEVEKYYQILKQHKLSLVLKRLFDIIVSVILLIILAIPMLIISICIEIDTRGPIFYRQTRITTYGKEFRIHKFRTMFEMEYKDGNQVTTKNDDRVTRVGRFIRKYRLDEFPQLYDVLRGDMSFVGTRPEVPKYVNLYTDEMKATLLLPAGITSEACIRYKDEAELIDGKEDVDKVYVDEVLPGKMVHNLQSIENFSFWGEIKTMIRTVLAVAGKNYGDDKVNA
jgi:lipopolysaccharide/colanic/teichoic acid biosynthesis glycosyltransferase